MRVFRTSHGLVLERDGRYFDAAGVTWDALFTASDAVAHLDEATTGALEIEEPGDLDLLAPIHRQEVWAAGVTYFRSRSARIAESEAAGGSDFYDRVYEAARPELFFKATPHRVAGPGQGVRVRNDSKWSVPEPELALAVSATGRIFGYTIGNDMSARDIEGENPLYLPQAKVYDGCCALGPGILLSQDPLSPDTAIQLAIQRDGAVVFEGETALSAMRRDPEELVEFLFRDNSFPDGCFLLTGTGIVPPDTFSLRAGDAIRITIDPIGVLTNFVAVSPDPRP